MKTLTINNRHVQVHDRLEQFNVNAATSNSIAYFGSNPDSGSMFFQFASGDTYIYTGITPEVRKGLWSASSIGSFVAKNIVKKFPSEKLVGRGVSSLLG